MLLFDLYFILVLYNFKLPNTSQFLKFRKKKKRAAYIPIAKARGITPHFDKTKIFALLCDDTEREFGKPSSAEKMKKAADENGWISISMRNDWTTIYGDNVKREN